MSLSIFICEDDNAQRAFVETVVLDYIKSTDDQIELVLSTDDPLKVLEQVEMRLHKNALYFLDVDLRHEMNGIDLAKQIREYDISGMITFITMHAEMSYLPFRYRIEALDYILKDRIDELNTRVRECIDVAYSRLNQQSTLGNDYIKIRSSLGTQKIPIDDIMYFETCYVPNKLILYTRSDRIEFRDTLKNISESRPDFFRCHKTYVVNLRNIKRISRVSRATGEIEMANGVCIPVANRKITEIRRIMML